VPGQSADVLQQEEKKNSRKIEAVQRKVQLDCLERRPAASKLYAQDQLISLSYLGKQ